MTASHHCLPGLIHEYQVIHQTGKKNFWGDKKPMRKYCLARILSELDTRYFLTLTTCRPRCLAVPLTLLFLGQAPKIFEIAAWGKPSIIIPGSAAVFHGDHQRKNAYHYAPHRRMCGHRRGRTLLRQYWRTKLTLFWSTRDHYDAMASPRQAFFTILTLHASLPLKL